MFSHGEIGFYGGSLVLEGWMLSVYFFLSFLRVFVGNFVWDFVMCVWYSTSNSTERIIGENPCVELTERSHDCVGLAQSLKMKFVILEMEFVIDPRGELAYRK